MSGENGSAEPADKMVEDGSVAPAAADKMVEDGSAAPAAANKMVEDGSAEPSDLEAKIIRQVEYYFGDINLVKDKFLQEQIKEDDGWVPLETMIKFKRLASLSMDFEVLGSAIKKSKAGLIEVGENKIRRNPNKKLPENTDAVRESTKHRVVYCKGFPLEVTLDEVMAFMEKYGQSEHIFMRKDRDKKFKGSVFCTYNSEESAKKFLAEENLKFKDGDEELLRYTRDAYFQKKNDDKRAVKEQLVKDRDKQKMKKEEEEEEAFKSRVQYDAVLVLSNLPADLKRESLKEKFEAFAPVQWIDFNTGEAEAKVRFSDAGGAKKAWEAAMVEAVEAGGEDAKVKVGDNAVEGRVMEGEEELEHWREVVQQQKASKFGRRRGGSGGGGGYRGGRGGGRGGGGRGGGGGGGHFRKRSALGGDDGPSEAKQAKTDGNDGPSAPKQAKTEGD